MIYCQFCLTHNEGGLPTCRKCGGRLLVLGLNQQWEEPETPQVSMDDHFLERISRIEEAVGGILEHLSRMSETLEVLDRNSFVTRSGLSALVDTLKETNLLREDVLNQRWESTMSDQMEEAGFRDRFIQMRGRFLALYRGKPEHRVSFGNFIEEAELLIYSDRSRECATVLGKALKLDLKNYELAYYLAEYYQQSGLNKEAMDSLQIARKANPDHADSLLMLGLLYYGDEKVEKAQKLLTRCIEVSPHNPVALLSMGSMLTADKRFEEAAPYLKRVNELEPQAQSYYLLGLGAKECGKNKEAITYLKHATELDPGHAEAIFTLGMAFLERGWSRKARACFYQAQLLNPGKLEYPDLDEPKETATKEGMDDESQEALRFAESLFHGGKLKQALPHYRRLLKKFSTNTILLSTFAVVNYSLRRYEETLRITQKLLDLGASQIVRCVAYTLKMETLRALARYQDAITLLRAMIAEFTFGYGFTVACYGLAMTMADMGNDLKEAEQLAQDAVDSSPPEFRHNAMDALGWVYFKQGRYEEALELMESVVNMSESTSHLYHYGMILLSLNLQDEAFKVFEQTVKLRSKTVQVDGFIFNAISREKAVQLKERNGELPDIFS